MKRALFAAFLLLSAAGAAADEQSVVGVYAELGARRGQGTGFLVSPAGEIVTAYHVIHGARRIDVFWKGEQFRDVVVARTLPELDLAVLKIERVPAGMRPLRLAPRTLTWGPGQPVRAFGFPRGIPNQRFDGTATQQGTWRSEQIRDDRDRRLFRSDGLLLIGLDLTIYSGMSGAPVILGDQVIGVLSGSLGAGRGLAWGIPVSYLESARADGRRASAIGAWPEFAMTQDWRNLRSLFRVDANATRVLDEYFATVDALTRTYDDLNIKVQRTRAVIALSVSLLAQPGAADGTPSAAADSVVNEQLFPALKEVAAGFIQAGEAAVRIQNATGRLQSFLEANYSGLPRTALNLRVAGEVNQAADAFTQRYAFLRKKRAEDPRFLEAMQIIQQAGSLPQSDKRRFVAEFSRSLKLFDRYFADWAGLKEIQERNARLREYREIGEFFQSVFFREQDLVSEPLSYDSAKSRYAVTLPKGWVTWSQELSRLLGVDPEPRVDLYFVNTGFFGDGREMGAQDTLVTVPLPMPGPSPSDETMRMMRAEFERQIAVSAPGLRNTSGGRQTLGAHTALVLRGVFGNEAAPVHYHNALVFGPGRMVWVNCYIRKGADTTPCRDVATSVRFY